MVARLALNSFATTAPCRRKKREVGALLQVRRRPEAGLCSALANWCHQSGTKAVCT